MTIDPAAVLAVISSLSSEVARLEQENAQLRQVIEARESTTDTCAPVT